MTPSDAEPTRKYRDRFAPVVDYVRENLTADLTVEALARRAHFSPYHFHRVFTAVMGETVALFVRRARLERAVQLMRASPRRPLGQVALEAGFGSASDFSRSFRRHFDMAPSRWDRRSPLVFRKNREASDREPSYALQELVAADGGPPAEVRVERTEPRTLAFVRVRRPFEPGALQRGYERLRGWMEQTGLEEEGDLMGLSWDDAAVTPPEQIRYDLAAPVPPGTPDGRGVVIRALPALRVARARATGSLARVARVWDDLYHRWLPSSSYEPRDLPPYERYRGWPDTLESDQWDLDCCIPVRPWGTRP